MSRGTCFGEKRKGLEDEELISITSFHFPLLTLECVHVHSPETKHPLRVSLGGVKYKIIANYMLCESQMSYMEDFSHYPEKKQKAVTQSVSQSVSQSVRFICY